MKTVLGVDLGGTKILIGELDMLGNILLEKTYVSDVASQERAIQRIIACLHDFTSQPMKGEVQAIGIGLVGRVDRKKGRWLEIHPELAQPIDAAQIIGDEFGLPCFIGNDVYCASLAEQTYGMGRISDNFVYLNIGTGLAARCIIDGKILEGSHFDAGEIGHVIVDMNHHAACICGSHGCAESLISGSGLHERTVECYEQYPDSCIQLPETGRISAQALFDGYEQGDALCAAVLHQAMKALAAVIMNLIRFCDPEAIVLGGGIGGSAWVSKHLMDYLNPKTIRFITKGIQKTSLDARTIGLKGSAQLAIQFLSEEE